MFDREPQIKRELDGNEKSDPSSVAMDVFVKAEEKESLQMEEKKPDTGIELAHEVPALHNAIREYRALRSSLFLSHNRFKRALSARTDLALRFVQEIIF